MLLFALLSYPLLSPDSLTLLSISLSLNDSRCERPWSLPILRSWRQSDQRGNFRYRVPIFMGCGELLPCVNSESIGCSRDNVETSVNNNSHLGKETPQLQACELHVPSSASSEHWGPHTLKPPEASVLEPLMKASQAILGPELPLHSDS